MTKHREEISTTTFICTTGSVQTDRSSWDLSFTTMIIRYQLDGGAGAKAIRITFHIRLRVHWKPSVYSMSSRAEAYGYPSPRLPRFCATVLTEATNLTAL